MEPISAILAAASAANTAFTVIKKMVATGKEIEQVAGQIGKWYSAFGTFNQLAADKANKKPPLFKRLLNEGSVEQEALQITMHKQALYKQEYELKVLIIAHYGQNVYNEMIMERVRVKKERDKRAREQKLRQQDFFLTVKYGAAIAFLVVAVIALFYYLKDLVRP